MIKRGGRGRSGRGRSNAHGRRHNYTGATRTSTSKKGLYIDLKNNVFYYGHKAAADQMCTSMEKILQYVSMNYGQDISNELQNKATLNIIETVHTDDIIIRQVLREAMVRTVQVNLQAA